MRRKPKGIPLMTGSKTTTLTDTAKDLRDQAADYVETLRPHLASALSSVEEFVESTAKPALSEAGARAREAAEDAAHQARTKGLPLVATGAAYAAEKAEEAKKLAAEKAEEISGKKAKRRRRRVRLFTLLGLGTLAAVAAVVARKAMGGGQDAWQAPATPPAPASGPVSQTATPEGEFDDPAKTTQGDPLTDPLN